MSSMFDFNIKTVCASVAGSIAGITLQDFDEFAGRVVLIMNGIFILIGIVRQVIAGRDNSKDEE